MMLITPAAKPSDFADLVNLLQHFTETTNALRKLEGRINAAQLETVKDHIEDYKTLQTSLSEDTAAIYFVTPEQILSDTRIQPVATARQMAMAITRERCSVSLDAIASAFNRLNHETIQFA